LLILLPSLCRMLAQR